MFKSKLLSKSLTLPGTTIIVSFRFLLLMAIMATLILPSVPSIVSAQQTDSPWYEVRSIYTEDYGVNIPSGFAYSPNAKAFLLWNSGGDVTGVGLNEDKVDTQNLNLPVEDARNLAFNGNTNTLFVQSNANTQLEEFSVNNGGIPVTDSGPTSRYNLRSLNLSQARGMAFDPNSGRMFVLNSNGNQIVILTPVPVDGYDADTAVRDGRVERINLRTLGYSDLRGVAYNPNTDNLYLLDAVNHKVYEITQDGKDVSFYDLSSLQLTNPGTILFAPSGDATDDPNKQNLFILDGIPVAQPRSSEKSGVKFASPLAAAAASGSINELSLVAPLSLPAGTTFLPSTLVQIVNTSNTAWNPSSPDPSGIDYWPLTGRLLTSDSEVDEMPPYFTGDNVYSATTSGTLVSTCSTTNINRTGFSNEPTGVAINPFNNRVYFSDDNAHKVFEVSLGSDGIYCTADDTITSVSFATDTEDVAYGNNTLYIAGGIDAEVFEYSLGPNGVLGGGDDVSVTHWDTASLGFNDLEGIGFNADNGTLFIVSTQGSDKYLGETTPSGTLLRAYDLSLMGSGSNIRSDVAYAPSSHNPSVKSIYIVSRGIDNGADPNENDGKWWEISLGGGSSNTPTSTFTPTLTNTADPNNTATFTATPTNTPTSTFTPTATATISPTPPPSSNPLYISLTSSGTVGGVAAADEDILRFDGQTWSLFFDGSDVGVGGSDTFGFTALSDTSFLFAFTTSLTLNGIAVTPQDIVRFDATSMGTNTAGTFSIYLNGIDVGLDANAESIDSISVLPDGRVLISTTGNPSVPGVSGAADEDILAFTPTTLGDVTSGTWDMYFDGSDVGLSESSNEDIDALDVVGGNIYLSTLGDFSVAGLVGADEDIFICSPTSLGSVTTCAYSPVLYFDGSTWGLSADDVDAFNFLTLGPSPTPTSTSTPTNTPTPTFTFTPTSTSTSGPSPTPTNTPTETATPTNTSTFTPSPTPAASDQIFADGFESGSFSAWSSSTTGGGDLSVSNAAALVGTNGMQMVINDTGSIYVTDNTPNLEPRYRMRFYFDPNSITMANSDMFTLFYGFSGSTSMLRVDFRFSSGVYQLMARALDDAGVTWSSTPWFTISDALHFVEFDWQASTAVGANDGTLTFWIDGTQLSTLTGIDNDTRRIDIIRLGAVTGLDAGTIGTVYFDAFDSRRQNYIGP